MNEDIKHINFIEDDLKDFKILSKLKDENNLDVPDNYFSDLESNILNKIDNNVIINKRLFHRGIVYAAAASITILMIFIGLHFSKSLNSKPEIVNEPHSDAKELKMDEVKSLASDNIINNQTVKDSIIVSVKDQNTIKHSIAKITHPIVEYKLEVNKRPIVNKKVKPQTNNPDDNYSVTKNTLADINNSSPAFLSSSVISNTSNSNYTKKVNHTIARINTSTHKNIFLPSDTCLNSDFVYEIDTTGYWELDFVWNNSKGISSRFNKSGTYFLQYWLKDSLLGVDSMKITIIAKPKPNIISKNEICNHESLLLNAGMSGVDYNYKWSVSDLNKSEVYVNNLKPGDILIELEVSSCADTVDAKTLVHINDCQLMIPNVFTPNGDGINDYFFIKGLSNYPGSSLTILDRNGNVVFQSLDYKNNWKAENLSDGTYFYSLIINDKSKIEKGGIINIIRK